MTAPAATLRDYAPELASLADLAGKPHAVADVLRRALAALGEIIPYDLAVVYELHGRQLRARVAEGPLADARIRAHQLSLDAFPTIERALERRRPHAFTEHEHNGDEGDPYDGILDLPPGHSCMVVPLYAGEETLGLITLDRRICETYPPSTLQLSSVVGQLVSLSLLLARQRQQLERYSNQLAGENRLLREASGSGGEAVRTLEGSASPVMRELWRKAQQVAAAPVPVLIEGQTGTGKEVLARAIHEASPRADRPFVTLNCAALPEHLIESELFGHVAGAFTGASRDRAGRFATAHGGTLLLDEIGDLPIAAQAKLLRVLQEGSFQPVGADRTVQVDVRVIAATHVDLKRAVAEGRFREDLYFRLAIFPLHLPPLRERRQDILPIAESLLSQHVRGHHRGPWTLGPAARAALADHDYPGNVRELVNIIERAVINQPAGRIEPQHLGLGDALPRPVVAAEARDDVDGIPSFREQEREFLVRVLHAVGGKVQGPGSAAEALDLPPTTLASKLKKHGLRARDFK